MSIYLKVWLDGAVPKLFCLRELHTTVGLDSCGQLSFSHSASQLFSLIVIGDGYLITSSSQGIKLDGHLFDEATVSPGRIFRLEAPGLKVIGAISSALSEILARAPSNFNNFSLVEKSRTKSAEIYSVCYELAGIKKLYPLPQSNEVSLGSSEKDGIYLPINGIKPNHLRFLAQDRLTIFPCGGSILHNGQEVRLPVMLDKPSTIVIQPIGIPIEITRSLTPA
jgi:hypothetical protein